MGYILSLEYFFLSMYSDKDQGEKKQYLFWLVIISAVYLRKKVLLRNRNTFKE